MPPAHAFYRQERRDNKRLHWSLNEKVGVAGALELARYLCVKAEVPAIRVHFEPGAEWHEQKGRDMYLAEERVAIETVAHEVAHWIAERRDRVAHNKRHHGKEFRRALDLTRGWAVVWYLEEVDE